MAKRKGILGRSDIPYAQRIKMKKHAMIVHERETAAKAIMFCNACALHELEGIGYKRLIKYALHFKSLNDDFYEDPILEMEHAKRRMEQMGMPISGELFTIQGKDKLDTEIKTHALQAAQVALICAAVAMNDMFRLGKERQERVTQRANELAGRYKEEGMQFLLDYLEKIGFVVVDGEVRGYLDDDGNPITARKAKDYFAKDGVSNGGLL
jgi:hypothetical protein